MKITAIIPTFNEEIHIEAAIKSVDFADEVIVIDSFSTDATLDIAKQFGVRVLQRVFDDFSSQKNYAIAQASHDWIYVLDADERVSPKLKSEILELVKTIPKHVGYYVKRNFYFSETKIRFSGWQRDKVLRLFRRDVCVYKKKIHEEIVSNGSLGFLEGRIEHYSYRNYQQYISKLKFYATLQAKELLQKGQCISPYHLIIKPIVRFFIQYVIQLGFLDGVKGFVISWAHAYGVLLRYLELLKLKYGAAHRKNTNSIQKFDKTIAEKDLSVLIVNYKSWSHLAPCLDALCKLSQKKFTLEIIVVDNQSNDGVLEDFSKRYPQVRFIENSGNNGFANACNLAAMHSVGGHLLFLNPDTVASEKPIAELLRYAKENPRTGIVSCNQKNTNGSYEDTNRLFPGLFTLFGLSRAVYRIFKKESKTSNDVVFPDWVSGSLVFISRSWFAKIEGWNEDYWMYFEDVDLSKKVRLAGGNIALLKEVEIIHNHGGSSRVNIKTATITKSEVLISKHVYLHNHFKGLERSLILSLLVFSNLLTKFFTALIGLVFFFVPKLRLNIYLFTILIAYYYSSYKHGTWLSKRSVNFLNKTQ